MPQSSFKSKLYEDLLRHVDFNLRDDVGGSSRPLKPSVRKYVEKWLLQRASCRLQPAWTDLGALFWPRWVRRGSCGEEDPAITDVRSSHGRRRGRRRAARSCSWPPGMRCVPETSQTVRLLRWHCSASARQRRPNNDQKTGGSREARRKRRRRGRRSGDDDTAITYGDVSRGGEWRWRCRWKKVPYSVTTACFCSC